MRVYRCVMQHVFHSVFISLAVRVCGCFLSNHSCYFSSKGEECDDMNSMNGDGCSSQCKKEPFFNCIGKSYISLYKMFIVMVIIEMLAHCLFLWIAVGENTGNRLSLSLCAFDQGISPLTSQADLLYCH